MSQGIKLFFDVCLSKKLPKVIQSVYGEDHPDLILKHLTEYFQASDDDGDWLPLLKEGGWIVITADRGRESKKTQLPLLCSHLQITHVSMTPAFHRSGYAIHRHALLSLFPQLTCLDLLPVGTRVSLGFKPYHRRNWPSLQIDGHALDAWCLRKGIQLPGLLIKSN